MTTPLLTVPAQLPGLLEHERGRAARLAEARGEKPLRARQVRRWLLAGGAESFEP